MLELWRDGKLKLALSPEIANEYEQVSHRLAVRHPSMDPTFVVELVVRHSEIVPDVPLSDHVCADPDDDKFLACAITSGASAVVTGDKELLAVSEYQGVEVMTPREFVDRHLLGADNDLR